MVNPKKEIIEELPENTVEKFPDDDGETDTENCSDDEDESIEITPPKPPQRKKETKPRPPKTPAQLATVKKMMDARARNIELRRQDKLKQEAIEKELLEQKIVKKAVAIKKKQIKKQKALDEISDDDETVESVKKRAAPRVIEKIVYVEKQKPKWEFL